MSNIDDNFIEEIKSKSNIIDVISSYLQLNKSGENFKGLCPFHNEKTPSFMVSEKKQYYKCFGCGEGGDVISFLMKKENLDFMDALKILAEKAMIKWPDEEMSIEYKELAKLRDRIFNIHIEAARFYFSLLWSNKDNSLSYIKKRGLSDKNIKRFGLGYAPKDGSLGKYLDSKGYIKEELLESGLFVERSGKVRERFFSRLMFPIFDVRGKVIAFGGRVLGDGLPKYLNSSDTKIFHKKEQLYGLNIAKASSSNGFILTEGYMDVISLHQYGFTSAIASLGTSLTKDQALAIKKYTDKVYICYDSDEAGINATLRAIEVLLKTDISPYIVDINPHKDPDDYLSKEGEAKFRATLKNAYSSLRFKVEYIMKKHDINNDKGQIDFIKEVADILKIHNSPVEVEKEILRISKITNISVKALGSEVYGKYFSPKQFQTQETKNDSNITHNIPKIEKINVTKSNGIENEKALIFSILRNQEALDIAIRILEPEDFCYEETQNIFAELVSKDNNKNIIEKEFMGNNIYEALSTNEIYSLVILLKKNSLKIKIEKLQTEQNSLNPNDESDFKRILEIGMDVIELQKELDRL
ncbi:DNA primase [Acetoanaerobium pronyense]|uniref:DNA primase n=1 Tax=Acetoanaerobium pronyense TaxID=1482736 RepID=A0ABS4KF42_9FIRM|nr:DNA primase [Acetoanaerobium pronyense]MBP2026379.1 DNA primase [Acetoanaerobium pronyense]